jgi:hypothetical protein
MDTNKLFLAFSYCNLFFKMSKNMKMIRCHITKKKSISPALPQGYRLISLA